jgi:hypothetical protein
LVIRRVGAVLTATGGQGRTVRALAVLWCVCLAPAAALGHAAPRAIEIWGAFLPDTQVCLRVMSRAAHACFDTVLGLEQQCRDGAARGEGCDRERLEAETAEALRLTRVAMGEECTLGELTELGYIGFFDAETDLANACQHQARAAMDALYAPARSGAPTAAAAACMAASAAYGRKCGAAGARAPDAGDGADRLAAADQGREAAVDPPRRAGDHRRPRALE